MNGEEISKKPIYLSNWWWLRIVWSVWVDQLWYWQNVRPQLQGRREAIFFAQALLGSSFFGLVLATVIGLIIEATGIHMIWKLWGAGFLIGIIATAMLGGIATLTNGASFGVSACAIYGVLCPIFFSILLIALVNDSRQLSIYGGVAFFFALGISDNLYNVIKKGVKLSSIEVGGHAISYTIGTTLIARNLLLGIAMGVAFILGAYLSGYWATRQIPDMKIRKKLANAERPFLDSLRF